jgi:hypothetical protein
MSLYLFVSIVISYKNGLLIVIPKNPKKVRKREEYELKYSGGCP